MKYPKERLLALSKQNVKKVEDSVFVDENTFMDLTDPEKHKHISQLMFGRDNAVFHFDIPAQSVRYTETQINIFVEFDLSNFVMIGSPHTCQF